jgi:Tol biopolymer transport system component
MRRTGTRLGTLVALLATGLAIAAPPAGAAYPTGGMQKVSPEGNSSRAVIDDAGRVVAYLSSGNVWVAEVGGGATRITDGGRANEPAISGDGNVVAFTSDARLTGEDVNDVEDVYVYNRASRSMTLVSAGAAGPSFSPALNGDGRLIAYSAPGAPGGAEDIFVRTLGQPGPGLRINTGQPGCDCHQPDISNDGNLVAFEATDGGVWMWDRASGRSNRISPRPAADPSVSADGGSIAFQSQGTVSVFDRRSNEMLTLEQDGAHPVLSGDGSIVVFQSNFVTPGDTNSAEEILAFDRNGGGAGPNNRPLGQLYRVSTSRFGGAGNAGSFSPAVSADGGTVVFESMANDLVEGDGNGARDIFVRLPGAPVGPVGPPGCPGCAPVPAIPGNYWLVASDGGIFSFSSGTPRFFGSAGNIRLNQPIVGMTASPSGQGYWFVASDGGIFSYGDAKFFGSTGNIRLNRPIVGMTATPTGKGYWLVATDGGIFSFGDAKFFGSTGNIRLNKPIVGMAATPTGQGYWLVASDGGIFAFGDAKFLGSTGDIRLNQPIVGMAANPNGGGYWLVATDGGIFAFGSSRFMGSTGAIKLNQPIVGMAPTRSGNGYWFVARDGGIFAFGDAGFWGSMGGKPLNRPIVGMAGSGV